MRITKDNIDEYLNEDGDLYLYSNKEITHIDYLPDNIKYFNISNSNIEEITCKLPEGLLYFYCYNSNLKTLPLLPKSLECFNGSGTNLPKEFHVDILFHNIKCNKLRNLQLLELI